MGRLKGLEEMPERTGLEIDWNDILPGTYSSRRAPSRHGGATRLLSGVMAVVVVGAGVYMIGADLVPTPAQVDAEIRRQVAVLTANRNRRDSLAPRTRPGIDGVSGGTPETATDVEKGVAFPAGRIDGDGGAGVAVAISDTTGDGMGKMVVIRPVSGGDGTVTAYVAGNGEASLRLTPGGYAVSVAEGATWMGDRLGFGEEGTYYAPQILDVREGTSVRVELPPPDGRRRAATVDRDRF